MKRGWPSLPATVICLFALATSASAECAWVQWSWISTPGLSPEEQRQQEGGFATLKDCHEALKRSYLSVGVPPHVIPAFISNHKLRFVGKRSDGGELTGWGICLPDTVDPLVPGGGVEAILGRVRVGVVGKPRPGPSRYAMDAPRSISVLLRLYPSSRRHRTRRPEERVENGAARRV